MGVRTSTEHAQGKGCRTRVVEVEDGIGPYVGMARLNADFFKGPLTLLTALHAIAHFHMPTVDVKQRYHLYHRHECDATYDKA